MTTETIPMPETMTCPEGHEHDVPPVPVLLSALAFIVAHSIAESRYTAWNDRAGATPWQEFLMDDAHEAESLKYVEDGLRDAHAVLAAIGDMGLVALNVPALAALAEELEA